MQLVWLSHTHGVADPRINGDQNANDGISMVQTAEGALQEVLTCFSGCVSSRCRRSGLKTVTTAQRTLRFKRRRRSTGPESTSFNAQNILDGTANRLFQIGDQAGDTIRIGLGSVDTASLGMAATEGASSDPVDMLVSARLAGVL